MLKIASSEMWHCVIGIVYPHILQNNGAFIFRIKWKVMALWPFSVPGTTCPLVVQSHIPKVWSFHEKLRCPTPVLLLKVLMISLGVMLVFLKLSWHSFKAPTVSPLSLCCLVILGLLVVQVQWGLQIPILRLPGTSDTFPLPALWLWLQLLWQDAICPAHCTPWEARYTNGWRLPAVPVECVMWSIRVCIHCHTRYVLTVDRHQNILL